MEDAEGVMAVVVEDAGGAEVKNRYASRIFIKLGEALCSVARCLPT